MRRPSGSIKPMIAPDRAAGLAHADCASTRYIPTARGVVYRGRQASADLSDLERGASPAALCAPALGSLAHRTSGSATRAWGCERLAARERSFQRCLVRCGVTAEAALEA